MLRIRRPQFWPLFLSIILGATLAWFAIISLILLFAGGYNAGWSVVGPLYYPVAVEGVAVWMIVAALFSALIYDSFTKLR